tara:strand:- start:519 stop:779 length:261 start_codon:yes stop_codon:yes gene_type:complete
MKPICEINSYGTKRWLLHGKRHREDGPAIEFTNGNKYWFINDILHREDGPACEYTTGDKEWYYQGKQIFCEDNQEFLRMIKLKAFL